MKKFLIFLFLIFGMFFLSFVSSSSLFSNNYGSYISSSPQYIYGGEYGSFSSGANTGFDRNFCQEGTDFLMQIEPLSCSPMVVRSDLLEEQDVPVFCKIEGIKINPLVDVDFIRGISASRRDLSPGIKDVGFYPKFSALWGEKSVHLINAPQYNDFGYVSVLLKRNPNESSMPDFVSGNLTLKLNYDLNDAFGIRDRVFYSPEMSDEKWKYSQTSYSFWNGKGAIRVENIEDDRASVSVYSDVYEPAFSKSSDRDKLKFRTLNLRVGERSEVLLLPSFECLAGLEVSLDKIENPDTYALLRVNSEYIQVQEGDSFLGGYCRVLPNSLYRNGLNQNIRISCETDEGAKTFSLRNSPKVKLGLNGGSFKEYSVGEWLYFSKDKNGEIDGNIYLGYVDLGRSESLDEENLEVYLVFVPGKVKVFDILDQKIVSYVEEYSKSKTDTNKVKATLGSISSSISLYANKKITGVEIRVLTKQESSGEFKGTGIVVDGFGGKANRDLSFMENVESNYSFAKNDFDRIVNSFLEERIDSSLEKISSYENGEIISEQAFVEKIKLARDLDQNIEVREFCKEFGLYYPDSELFYFNCQISGGMALDSESVKEVVVQGKLKEISFFSVYEPSYSDYGISLEVKDVEKGLSEYFLIKDLALQINEDTREYVILKEGLTRESAKIEVALLEKNKEEDIASGQLFAKPYTLKLNEPQSVGENYVFTLKEINLNKIARVSLHPKILNQHSESNISFKIGIEKRAIQLIPEKTEERIEKLNKTISDFEKVNRGLERVIQGMTGACYATGGALTIKNIIQNADGKSIARRFVMNSVGGWNEICKKWDLLGENYVSEEDCLFSNNDKIQEEVNFWHSTLEEQNSDIKRIQEEYRVKGEGILGQDYIKTNEFVGDYSGEVSSLVGSLSSQVNLIDGNGNALSLEGINLSYEAYNLGDYDLEELRQIDLYSRILAKDSSNEVARKELTNLLDGLNKNQESRNFLESLRTITGIQNVFINDEKKLEITSKEDLFGTSGYSIDSNRGLGLSDESKVCLYTSEGKEYLLNYDDSGRVIQTYSVRADKKLTSLDSVIGNPLGIRISVLTKEKMNNKYLNSEVRFYEEGVYKGLPSLVPIDLNRGWYVYLDDASYLSSSTNSYLESGRINSFWMCNVGENGLEEGGAFKGVDSCTLVNLFAPPRDGWNLPGIETTSEANRLITKATSRIIIASKSYKEGVSSVPFEAGEIIKVGLPELSLPGVRCTDLMSPSDCQILFNVCDPVLCPPSRCDFGGKYPVKDVVQSGIIGSLLLCAPNWNEGIYLPICLSGVHAGMENLLSVLKSTQDCLEVSLETGQMVGICDQITSVYICEEFWRQAAPLAKVGIPKLLSKLSKESVHGGGEYLTFTSSLKNAKESLKYYTDFYAANAFKAFQIRSTSQVGGLFCKAFASVTYPTGVDLLSALTAVQSPSQFTGKFDEIPFTTATNPPISQYKVTYHIYAGNDRGASYRVYLRQGGAGSYFQDGFSGRLVGTGYIKAGEYKTESVDFTSPSGYKELCIRVNDQEECGFGEVSTSFAVRALKDMYLEKQITEFNVTSQEECVSGSFNWMNLLNPNVQEGIDNLLDPEIYNKGVIRTCSNEDPGLGSEGAPDSANSRWKDVGYCGDPEIRCWLDLKSLDDIFEFEYNKDKTLEEAYNDSISKLVASEKYMDFNQFSNFVNNLKNKNNLEKIEFISKALDRVYLGNQKALLYILRGKAYGDLARESYEEEKEFGVFGIEYSSSEKVVSEGIAPEIEGVDSLEAEKMYNPDYYNYKTRSYLKTGVFLGANGEGSNLLTPYSFYNEKGEDIDYTLFLESGNVVENSFSVEKKEEFKIIKDSEGKNVLVVFNSKIPSELFSPLEFISSSEFVYKGDIVKIKGYDSRNRVFRSFNLEVKKVNPGYLILDGEEIFDSLEGAPVFNVEGKVIGFVINIGGADEDITVLPFEWVSGASSFEESEDELFGKDYVSPKFYLDKVGLAGDICLMYREGEWKWVKDCKQDESKGDWASVSSLIDAHGETVNEDYENVLKGLISKSSYLEGLEFLLDVLFEEPDYFKTDAFGGDSSPINFKLKTDDFKLILNEEPFIKFGGKTYEENVYLFELTNKNFEEVFFKFDDYKWSWTPDKDAGEDNSLWVSPPRTNYLGIGDDSELQSYDAPLFIKSIIYGLYDYPERVMGTAILFDKGTVTIMQEEEEKGYPLLGTISYEIFQCAQDNCKPVYEVKEETFQVYDLDVSQIKLTLEEYEEITAEPRILSFVNLNLEPVENVEFEITFARDNTNLVGQTDEYGKVDLGKLVPEEDAFINFLKSQEETFYWDDISFIEEEDFSACVQDNCKRIDNLKEKTFMVSFMDNSKVTLTLEEFEEVVAGPDYIKLVDEDMKPLEEFDLEIAFSRENTNLKVITNEYGRIDLNALIKPGDEVCAGLEGSCVYHFSKLLSEQNFEIGNFNQGTEDILFLSAVFKLMKKDFSYSGKNSLESLFSSLDGDNSFEKITFNQLQEGDLVFLKTKTGDRPIELGIFDDFDSSSNELFAYSSSKRGKVELTKYNFHFSLFNLEYSFFGAFRYDSLNDEIKSGDEACADLGGTCAYKSVFDCSESWESNKCLFDLSSDYQCCTGDLIEKDLEIKPGDENDNPLYLGSFTDSLFYARDNYVFNGKVQTKCYCGDDDSCEAFSSYVEKYSEEFSIEDGLILIAMAMQESNCKPGITASDGGTGALQISEGTFFDAKCDQIVLDGSYLTYADIKDNLEANIACSAKILKKKYDLFKNGLSENSQYYPGDDSMCIKFRDYTGWDAAIRGYNGWGCLEINKNYVEEVNQIRNTLALNS